MTNNNNLTREQKMKLLEARDNIALASRMGCCCAKDYDTWHDKNSGQSPKEHELLNQALHIIDRMIGNVPDYILKMEREARCEVEIDEDGEVI